MNEKEEKLITVELEKLEKDLKDAFGEEDYIDVSETIKETMPDASFEEKMKTIKYIRTMTGLTIFKTQKSTKAKKTDKQKKKSKEKMKKKSKKNNRKK